MVSTTTNAPKRAATRPTAAWVAADDEEMEAEAGESWNPADWNSSDAGQAAIWMADEIAGDFFLGGDENEEEEKEFVNPFAWLFGPASLFMINEEEEEEAAAEE